MKENPHPTWKQISIKKNWFIASCQHPTSGDHIYFQGKFFISVFSNKLSLFGQLRGGGPHCLSDSHPKPKKAKGKKERSKLIACECDVILFHLSGNLIIILRYLRNLTQEIGVFVLRLSFKQWKILGWSYRIRCAKISNYFNFSFYFWG